MKFMKWKIWSLTCVICLLPILFGLSVWNELPEIMAIHFDINNNPDGFAPRWFTVIGLPVMMVLLQTFCCVINDINAKKYGDRKKLELATKWIIPVMSLILQPLTIGYSLGWDLDIRKIVMVIVGGIFIVIGNYLPKFDRVKNFDVPTDKARKINRVIGYMSFILGIVALVTVFLPPMFSVIWILALIPYAVISVIYSIKVARK